MSKIAVILWLVFSAFALAQEQSVSEVQPCWEKEVKPGITPEKKSCYQQFLQEVDRQIKADASKEVLENLELAGVNFVKALGISGVQAQEMVSGHFTELQLRNVPFPKNEVVIPAPAPTPTPTAVVLKETQKQSGFAKRSDPVKQDALRSERREGWKAGLPQPETNTGNCWEETHPTDPIGCLAQLKQFINQVKSDKSFTSQEIRLKVKNLNLDKEKLEKLQKDAEKVVKTQQTLVRSRARASVGRLVCSKLWVSEENAGPGSQWNPSVTLTIVNNTGMDIQSIALSDKGVIVENLCSGGTIIIHRGWNGNMNGQNFSFIAIADVIEGGTPRKYLWKQSAYIYPSGNAQSQEWMLTRDNRQYGGYW